MSRRPSCASALAKDGTGWRNAVSEAIPFPFLTVCLRLNARLAGPRKGPGQELPVNERSVRQHRHRVRPRVLADAA
jgi:hypothetical protein